MNKHNNKRPTNCSIRKCRLGILFFLILILTTFLSACGSGEEHIGASTAGPIDGSLSGSLGGGASPTAVKLAWEPSPSDNVAGYKIYYNSGEATFPLGVFGANEGTSPISVGNTTTATITGLISSELHYFTVTTYDYAGNESTFSNIASIYPAVE